MLLLRLVSQSQTSVLENNRPTNPDNDNKYSILIILLLASWILLLCLGYHNDMINYALKLKWTAKW